LSKHVQGQHTQPNELAHFHCLLLSLVVHGKLAA
jgi:hypothetical protein